MKILLATLGSRGDVQPYLALAVGLHRAGHRVSLAAPATFGEWIQGYGVEAVPLRFDPQEAMQKLGKGQGGLRTMGAMLNIIKAGMQDTQEQVWRAAQTTDFFIQSATGLGVMEVAQMRGLGTVRGAFAYLFPFMPTRAWPMVWLPMRSSLGGRYNLLTHHLMARVLWQVGGPLVNDWRKRLGLKSWRSQSEMLAYAQRLPIPFLYGYSPSVFPKPADWDDLQHITGYWFLDPPPDWQPAPELVRFLESGPPPVYVGFGSMNSENAEQHTRLALRALELSGQRGLLLTGWGGLSQSSASPNVLFVENIPHAWLFLRMAAVVHHGGAGTTGAGLRAGVPSIIPAFGGDQFAWADRVVKLGVGPHVPGIKTLTAEKLAEAINTAVSDSAMRARAAALGEKIRAEDGVARAIALIERHAEQFMLPGRVAS